MCVKQAFESFKLCFDAKRRSVLTAMDTQFFENILRPIIYIMLNNVDKIMWCGVHHKLFRYTNMHSFASKVFKLVLFCQDVPCYNWIRTLNQGIVLLMIL